MLYASRQHVYSRPPVRRLRRKAQRSIGRWLNAQSQTSLRPSDVAAAAEAEAEAPAGAAALPVADAALESCADSSHPHPIDLPSRLTQRIGWWRQAGASRRVLGWLRHGVRPQFTHHPRKFYRKPIPVQTADRDWVQAELQRHLATGAIEPATCAEYSRIRGVSSREENPKSFPSFLRFPPVAPALFPPLLT